MTQKKSVLGNMILRQTMGGLRKEDIPCFDTQDDLEKYIKDKIESYNPVDGIYDLSFKSCRFGMDTLHNLFLNIPIILRKKIKGLDVPGWDTRNIKDMCMVFVDLPYLVDIKGMSGWDMKNVINMSGMFLGCRRLKKIDFPELDNKISKDMSYMFTGCFEINDIGGLLGYNISNDTWSTDNKTLNGLKKCNFRINNGIIKKSKK